jgi:hypothetical protein
MALARRQHQGQWPASTVGSHMHLGAKTTLRAPEGFCRGLSALGSGGVLMGTPNRAIPIVDFPIQLTLTIGLGLQLIQNALPNSGWLPALEPTGNRLPLAIAFRQVPPGSAGPVDPEPAIEEGAMIQVGMACRRLDRWQDRRQAHPLLIA